MIRMSHLAIGVSDMEASLSFYRDILGLRVDFDGLEQFRDRDSETKFPVRPRRGVYLRYGEVEADAFLVLDQQHTARPPGRPAELFQLGVHHFGFWTDDVDAIVERCKDAGIQIYRGPSDNDSISYGEPAGSLIRTIMVKDPDGSIVQFDQRLTRRAQGLRP